MDSRSPSPLLPVACLIFLTTASACGPLADHEVSPELGSDESAASVIPGFQVNCFYSHRLKDDPIVFPGTPGAAHMHDFFGNRSTDAFSTTASLRAASTNCQNSDDKSGYWAPTLYSRGSRSLRHGCTRTTDGDRSRI
jgi:hypothetical protein